MCTLDSLKAEVQSFELRVQKIHPNKKTCGENICLFLCLPLDKKASWRDSIIKMKWKDWQVWSWCCRGSWFHWGRVENGFGNHLHFKLDWLPSCRARNVLNRPQLHFPCFPSLNCTASFWPILPLKKTSWIFSSPNLDGKCIKENAYWLIWQSN